MTEAEISTGGVLGHLWPLTCAMKRAVISMDNEVTGMLISLWFVTYLHEGRKHQIQLGVNEHIRYHPSSKFKGPLNPVCRSQIKNSWP